MITVKNHELIKTGLEGNGFHGVCKHCGLDCTTDLGWSSWAGVDCIERPVKCVSDMLPEVKHYIRHRGFKLDKDLIFRRPYDEQEYYTIEEMYKLVAALDGDLTQALRGKNEWITLAEYTKRKSILNELGYSVYYSTGSNDNTEDRKKKKEGLVQYSYYY